MEGGPELQVLVAMASQSNLSNSSNTIWMVDIRTRETGKELFGCSTLDFLHYSVAQIPTGRHIRVLLYM